MKGEREGREGERREGKRGGVCFGLKDYGGEAVDGEKPAPPWRGPKLSHVCLITSPSAADELQTESLSLGLKHDQQLLTLHLRGQQ